MAQVSNPADLVARRDALLNIREHLLAKSAPLRQARDAVQAQIAPLEAQARELTQQIHAVERPDLGNIDNELAVIARLLGARRLQAGN